MTREGSKILSWEGGGRQNINPKKKKKKKFLKFYFAKNKIYIFYSISYSCIVLKISIKKKLFFGINSKKKNLSTATPICILVFF